MAYDNTKDLFGDNGNKQTSTTYTGKAQTLVLDAIVGPNTAEHRVVSGDIRSAENSNITGGNDIINASSDVKNATITGDAMYITNNFFAGGADTFYIAKITNANANIIGDAKSVSNASMNGGHDNITVSGNVYGWNGNLALITGDVESFSGSGKSFNAGNDTITLKGNVTYTEIYGDAKTVSGTGNTIVGGHDTFILGSAATGATKSVSNSHIDLGHGDDKFTAYSTLNNTTVLAQTGKDNLFVSLMNDSTVDAGAGIDVINISSMQGTNNKILSGPDSALDTITLSSAIKTTNGQNVFVSINNNGTVQDTLFLSNGIAAGGSISITSNNGGLLVAKSGSASAGYTGFTMSGGSLTGGYAADDVRISTMSGGTLKLGGSNDSLTISTLSNGTIDGGTGSDRIVVNNITGGKISGGNDNDTILVKNFAGILDGGTGAGDILKLNTALNKGLNLETLKANGTILRFENFNFTEIAAGGNLTGSGVRDNINITDMTGGSLNAASGNDYITITTLSGGTVQGGSHYDNIKVTSVKGTGSVIDTGGAADTFLDTVTIVNAIKTTDGEAVTANINNGGSTQDTLLLSGGIAAGGKVALTSTNGGFTVAKSGSDGAGYVGFNMSGGNLTGSAADDEVHINALTGGNIHLSGGDDTITIKSLSTGTLQGGVGDDTFNVTLTGNNASIEGGDGFDIFNISASNPQSVGMGGFNINQDRLVVNGDDITSQVSAYAESGVYTHENVTIRFYTEVDNLTISNRIVDAENLLNNDGAMANIYINNGVHSGGSVLLMGENNSAFNVTSTNGNGFVMTGGNVVGSDYADTIKISTATNATVSGGLGNDNITLTTVNGGNYSGDNANDTITVGTLNAGTLWGGNGNDTINVNNYVGSTVSGEGIYGGAGDDTINVKFTGFSLSDRSIWGGSGSDTFNILSGSVGEVTLKDFNYWMDDDKLLINGKEFADDGKSYSSKVYAAQQAGETSLVVGNVTVNFTPMNHASSVAYNATIKTTEVYTNDNTDLPTVILLKGGIGDYGNLTLAGDANYVVSSGLFGDGFNITNGALTIDDSGIGNHYNDSITVNTMTGYSRLSTGEGYDVITINTVNLIDNSSSAWVDSGSYDDTIHIGTLNSGTVYGGNGDDTVYVDTMSGGWISGGDNYDTDTVIIGTANGGSVGGGYGVDKVEIINTLTEEFTILAGTAGWTHLTLHGGISTGGKLVFIAGADHNYNDGLTYYVDTPGFDMSDGEVIGAHTNDHVNINTLSGGKIDLSTGDNIFTIATMNGGELIAKGSEDFWSGHEFNIGTMNNGSITTENNGNAFDMTNMNGGTINVGNGYNKFTIGNITGGIFNLGDGDNEFIITNMSGGQIISSAGDDNNDQNKFTISGNMTGGSIKGNDYSNIFNIGSQDGSGVIIGSMKDGSLEGGASYDNFYIRINSADAGTLTGGAGRDNFVITGTEGSSITITDLTAEDYLQINGDYGLSDDAVAAKESGAESYIHDGVTIYFA